MDWMWGQQRCNRSASDMTFLNEEPAPSSHTQGYLRSMNSGHGRWLRMEGQDMTQVDI